MVQISFCKIQEESPVISRVFLGESWRQASIISLGVTGGLQRLNRGMSSLKFSSGGRSFELISSTMEEGMDVKKSLKRFAISCDSDIVRKILPIAKDLSYFLFIAIFIRSHVFFRLLWLTRSSFSRYNFFAARSTLLYRFLNFLKTSREIFNG